MGLESCQANRPYQADHGHSELHPLHRLPKRPSSRSLTASSSWPVGFSRLVSLSEPYLLMGISQDLKWKQVIQFYVIGVLR